MEFCSTRDKSVSVSAAQAIFAGISPDGGLFVPKSLPALGSRHINQMIELPYTGRAQAVLQDFLDGFSDAEIESGVNAAYGAQFASPKIAPLAKLSSHIYMLELWHGPTCAFKDMALQLLPHLLTLSAAKIAGEREARKTVNILVATSGDTGKAALEGFKDVPGTNIVVFYPSKGVSEIQKLQMITQEGANVHVLGVNGNFDDTQTAVKEIFADAQLAARLSAKNAVFSSANSINWGRLLPQIIYYISAYCDLVRTGEISLGDFINVAVPTGNFGNILAAYYAKKMGLPVRRLICASNVNNVLADFIATGTYDRRREFFATSSPSMDILISSNLERLLFAISGEDDRLVGEMMTRLSRNGVYTVPEFVKDALTAEFSGGFCGEQDTLATIKRTFDEHSYLLDTHTAVALKVYSDYLSTTGDCTKTVIASTASPFKFAPSILEALSGNPPPKDEFLCLEKLAEISGMKIPPQIAGLKGKAKRFEKVCRAKEDMPPAVCEILGI